MAHQIVIGYASNSSEFVEVHDDNSPNYSGSGSSSSVDLSVSSDWVSSIFGPPVTSDSESVELASSSSIIYYQYEDEDFLVECLTCRSFIELGTFYLGC
jgi:hypothetical protein